MDARKALATALFLWAGGVFAAPPPDDLNTRVSRLERILESQTLVDMFARLDSLQQEVQALRGKVDEQKHTLGELQRRNRELYTALERRVAKLEQESGALSDETLSDGAAVVSPDEQRAYQTAFELLRGLRYEEATKAFRQFLERYPQGHYAPMAQYWIGEASYTQRDFKAAIPEYRRLVEDYPSSPKAAEALFKIGVSHRELGDAQAAAKVFAEVIEAFPESPESAQARSLLQPGKSSH